MGHLEDWNKTELILSRQLGRRPSKTEIITRLKNTHTAKALSKTKTSTGETILNTSNQAGANRLKFKTPSQKLEQLATVKPKNSLHVLGLMTRGEQLRERPIKPKKKEENENSFFGMGNDSEYSPTLFGEEKKEKAFNILGFDHTERDKDEKEEKINERLKRREEQNWIKENQREQKRIQKLQPIQQKEYYEQKLKDENRSYRYNNILIMRAKDQIKKDRSRYIDDTSPETAKAIREMWGPPKPLQITGPDVLYPPASRRTLKEANRIAIRQKLRQYHRERKPKIVRRDSFNMFRMKRNY